MKRSRQTQVEQITNEVTKVTKGRQTKSPNEASSERERFKPKSPDTQIIERTRQTKATKIHVAKRSRQRKVPKRSRQTQVTLKTPNEVADKSTSYR
jgi:hypothetical protein